MGFDIEEGALVKASTQPHPGHILGLETSKSVS